MSNEALTPIYKISEAYYDAMCELVPGLAGVVEGTHSIVPKEPTEAMHNGLARDIMMWLDMGTKTPRSLFTHLEMLRRPIPDWLRNEPEMQALDHVPSKATRAVLIFRAMIEDANVA